MSKNKFTGTATQPQRNRKLCQFNQDQYCTVLKRSVATPPRRLKPIKGRSEIILVSLMPQSNEQCAERNSRQTSLQYRKRISQANL